MHFVIHIQEYTHSIRCAEHNVYPVELPTTCMAYSHTFAISGNTCQSNDVVRGKITGRGGTGRNRGFSPEGIHCRTIAYRCSVNDKLSVK